MVSQPPRFRTPPGPVRVSRSQASWTASSASVTDPSIRNATPRSRARCVSNRVSHFPAQVRAAARGQAPNVGGARIAAVARTLGAAYRQPAAASFEHGYHLAVGAGAGCLLLAALIAVAGFRGQQSLPAVPASREQQPQRAR